MVKHISNEQRGCARRGLRWVAVAATLLIGASVATAAPLIYYTTADVQMGSVNQRVLFPSTVEAKVSNGAERIQSVFDQLKLFTPGVYGQAQLQVGSDFDVTGSVVVNADGLNPEQLDQLVAEIYHSFTVHGAKSIVVPAFSGSPLAATDIAFVALQPVVPAWEALPPRNYGGALVSFEDGTIMAAADFYDKLKNRDATVGNKVMATLKGRNGAAKVRLLASLGELGLSDPTRDVVPLLEEPSARVQLAAVQALDGYRNQANVKAALSKLVDDGKADPGVSAAAVRALVAAGAKKYEALTYIEKLRDPNDGVVLDAVKKLIASKSPAAAPGLAKALGHPATEVREEALKGLITLNNGPAMVSALDDTAVSAAVKVNVAKALTGLKDREFQVAGLGHLVNNGTAADGARAAQGLASLKAKEALEALMLGLENGNENVRRESALALGEIGDPKALPALAKLTTSSKPDDRKVALDSALKILAAQPQSVVVEQTRSDDKGVKTLAIRALWRFADGGRNRAVVGVLREKLKEADVDVRGASVYALARIPDESVAQELLALKSDPEDSIRQQVAVAMGKSRNPAAVPTLIELLGDSSSDVKQAAAEGLALQKDPSAMDPLLQYVSYGKPQVRRAVFKALNAIATPAEMDKLLDIYSTALYDQDKQTKLMAIDGIAIFRDPRTVSALGGLTIDPEPEVQIAVLEKLGPFQDPSATEAIGRALVSDNKDVKMAGLNAIDAAQQDNAAKLLQEFVKNETDADLVKRANEVYDNLP